MAAWHQPPLFLRLPENEDEGSQMMLIINNIMIQSLSQPDSGYGNILYKYCDNLSLFFRKKKQPKFGQNGCSEENAVVIMKMIVR